MRELERELPATSDPRAPALPERLLILGAGRAGGSIAAAARNAGLRVNVGGREDQAHDAGVVLLCVPDEAITGACERIAGSLEPGTPVGHTSGATPLAALDAAAEAGCPVFSLHPLQTIPTARTDLAGAPCAVAGSHDDALALANALAERLGMRAFEVPEDGRAAYHAAASIASNFLVALEESASELLEAAGVANPREVLAPLVLRTAANWADAGAAALTGPIARGDEATVALHKAALAERAPQLVPLYETLADRTRQLGPGGGR